MRRNTRMHKIGCALMMAQMLAAGLFGLFRRKGVLRGLPKWRNRAQ